MVGRLLPEDRLNLCRLTLGRYGYSRPSVASALEALAEDEHIANLAAWLTKALDSAPTDAVTELGRLLYSYKYLTTDHGDDRGERPVALPVAPAADAAAVLAFPS